MINDRFDEICKIQKIDKNIIEGFAIYAKNCLSFY